MPKNTNQAELDAYQETQAWKREAYLWQQKNKNKQESTEVEVEISKPPAQPDKPAYDLDEPINGGEKVGGVRLGKQGGVFTTPVKINGVMALDFVVDSGAADVQIPADVASTLLRTNTIKSSDFLKGSSNNDCFLRIVSKSNDPPPLVGQSSQ